MQRILIAPSILSADFTRLGDELRAVDQAGADIIHIDVMDGHFAPNITLGPLVVKAAKTVTTKDLDVHLMISNPDIYIEAFADAGADWITVHIEAGRHLHRTISRIKDLGKRAGIVLNPATSLSTLDYILKEIDLVMLMSVNPGFGGQSFIPFCLEKITELRRRIDKLGIEIDIEIDGGISRKTISKIAKAGGNIFVAGSAVFGSGDYAATITELRRLAETGMRSTKG